MSVWIDEKLCNGCRRCLKACPYNAVEVEEGKARILERCTSCGACLAECPQSAIFTDIEPRSIPDFSDRKGVWVFAEQEEGRLMPVSLELLGKASELAAELDEDVSALLLGSRVSGLAPTLLEYGADRVYLAEHRALKVYRTLAYTRVVSELIEELRPGIVLMGATTVGRDLAPRVSRRVGAGLTADCTGLAIDPEERILLQTRPAFGGNVMATIANRYSRPQMATVRPGVMEPRRRQGGKGRVIRRKVSLLEKEIGVKLLERVKEKRKGEALSRARVVVAGGRGVGDRTGFRALERLAAVLGGEVAGTRVAVEEGWIPQDRQVGQTGLTVRPELYVACGISGAIQHRAGMMGSRYVIVVNRDPRAPIFQVADWGIVGDLRDVVPEMTKRLKRVLGR
ncbi:MAG: electron transfer flavoprotein subunit alpha [Deltaproteobacteria bacterium]|nr:electron transfer flavoprotein subunit alpha [Deltaproteobacteria bacterium]MBW1922499.1 electron transfer flavoprotein subunit alpha [Deltaproteobacteria bacterium]MBW1948316.1 electron transfer flavoprotein subunit alpha [Deltaproteobacteria bacterium]MBW2006601.1 electron transfer flavoprotein subunit alpha [Deltaproteobacteria bacterium]MBW2347781.1 electron transfer flavoprotein subunit alpha [Deltaproteobacteria bacterium]